MKHFLQFLTSKDLYKHLGLMIAIFFILVFIVSIVLNLYTDHGEKMSVPDFTDLTVEEAQEIAEMKGLRLEIIDSVYHSGAKPGAVVDQTPESNFSVKKNRKIFLTINSFTPEKVSMPSLIDVSLRQATSIIQSNGLKVGKLTYRPSIYKNLVLDQKINGKSVIKGTKIVKGTKVDLVLGLGETDEEVFLPDLIGANYTVALERIRNGSLNVGGENFHDSVTSFTDTMEAVVWRQLPKYEEGRKVKMGSLVDLWLARPQDSLHIQLKVAEDEIVENLLMQDNF